jgi:recombinational DNA repair protein (RecF pathway)
MDGTKTCCVCGETKPLDAFYRHPNTKDGHQAQCKACSKAYHARWRAQNRDYLNQYHSEYNRAKRAAASNVR